MKGFAEISMAVCLLANFGLGLALLLVERYFVIESEGEYVYGLTGRYKDNEYTSYTELITDCSEDTITPVGCDGLEALEEAGRLFQLLLIVELMVLVFFIFTVIGLRLMVKKLVKSISQREYIHPRYFSLTKLVIYSRHILLAQPPFLVSGVLVWGERSDLDEANGDLKSDIGIYLSYASCFLSFLLMAAYAYYVSSSKRKNSVHLLQMQAAKSSKFTDSKVELIEVSLDL